VITVPERHTLTVYRYPFLSETNE